MTTHLRGRITRLEQLATAEMDSWLRTLSDAEIDAIGRGGPGEVNLTLLTDEELERLARGEPIDAVRPDWRRLVNL